MHEFSVEAGAGRQVRCLQVGAAEGPTVVYLHGAPSSRLDVLALDERSARRGVRVVSFDRPGYGGSDPQPDYGFDSVADDVAAVADAVTAEDVWVVGQSAGAPFALACGARLGGRVRAVCFSGGNAPFRPDLPWWDRLSEGEQCGVLSIGTDDPAAERLLAEADAPFVDALALDDDGLLAFWLEHSSPSDRSFLESGFGSAFLVPSVRESLRQGQVGWARDNVVRMGEWAFDLGEVACPTLFWYGEQDAWATGRWLTEQVPGSALHVVTGQGHFSLFASWESALDCLGVR